MTLKKTKGKIHTHTHKKEVVVLQFNTLSEPLKATSTIPKMPARTLLSCKIHYN